MFFLSPAAAAESLQSCPTLWDPRDGSPLGSSIPGILQARTLEWVAISFSNAWTWKVKVKLLSCVRLFSTPWTAAHQTPPSMGFSRQEYWSGVPSPSPCISYKKLITQSTQPMKTSDYSQLSLSSVMKSISRVWLFLTPWTVACQAPSSMEFSRQGYWSGLTFVQNNPSSFLLSVYKITFLSFVCWLCLQLFLFSFSNCNALLFPNKPILLLYQQDVFFFRLTGLIQLGRQH